MKLSTTILILLACSFVSSNTVCAYERSDELLWACNGEASTTEAVLQRMHCIGYVVGVFDGAQIIFGMNPENKMICSPEQGMSADQQIRIVTKWLEKHPEELHQSARTSILMAFMDAFPCE